MKKIKCVLALALAVSLSGVCGAVSEAAITPSQLEEVKGIYVMQGSSQYTNGSLQLMYLGNNCCLFEFSMMEGSESGDTASDYYLSGVLGLEPDGTGSYEDINGGTLKLSFNFDGETVTVTEKAGGENLPIHLSGSYDFTDSSVAFSEQGIGTILEFLPPAATSLTETNRPYRLEYSSEIPQENFYEIKAIHIPTESVVADFYIAADMSAIYRMDTESPVLIFGTAHPMVEAENPPAAAPVSALSIPIAVGITTLLAFGIAALSMSIIKRKKKNRTH